MGVSGDVFGETRNLHSYGKFDIIIYEWNNQRSCKIKRSSKNKIWERYNRTKRFACGKYINSNLRTRGKNNRTKKNAREWKIKSTRKLWEWKIKSRKKTCRWTIKTKRKTCRWTIKTKRKIR